MNLLRPFRDPKKLNRLADRFPQYEIGKGSYGDLTVMDWGDGTKLKIGAYCSFARGVRIVLGGEHRLDWTTTYPFNVLWKKNIPGHPATRGDIVIGNDVWIALETVILSGVTIGNGACIGARSVVITDIPPYTIAAGHPAKVVGKRFSDEIVSRLQALAWWGWEEQVIERFLPLMLSQNIEVFLDAAERNAHPLT